MSYTLPLLFVGEQPFGNVLIQIQSRSDLRPRRLVPLAKMSAFRPLLQRVGLALSDEIDLVATSIPDIE